MPTAPLGLLLVGIGLLRMIAGAHELGAFWIGAAAVPGGVMLLELGIAAVWLTLRAGRGDAAPAVTLPPWWVGALAFVVAVGAGWLDAARRALVALPPVRDGWRSSRPWRRSRAWDCRAGCAPQLATPPPGVRLGGHRHAPAGDRAATPRRDRGDRRRGGRGDGKRAEHLETLQKVLQHLQGRTLTTGQAQALTQLAVQQPVVLAVGAFVLVFAGPATEELGKFGAILLFGRTRAGVAPLSTLTIFLIGLAAGLGFAATENIFYAAQAGPGGWAALALTRGVTPLMHGTASALFALGWARQRRDPGGWGLLRGALSALGLHAGWNLCSGLLIVALLFVAAGGVAGALAILLMLLAFGTLALLVLGSVLTLLRLRRTLALEAALPEAQPATAPAAVPGPNRGDWAALPEVRVQHLGEALAPATPVATDRR